MRGCFKVLDLHPKNMWTNKVKRPVYGRGGAADHPFPQPAEGPHRGDPVFFDADRGPAGPPFREVGSW